MPISLRFVLPSSLSLEPQVSFNVTQVVANADTEGGSPGGRIKGTALATVFGVITNDWRSFSSKNLLFSSAFLPKMDIGEKRQYANSLLFLSIWFDVFSEYLSEKRVKFSISISLSHNLLLFLIQISGGTFLYRTPEQTDRQTDGYNLFFSY